jgi:antirestriction protein ArdC
MGHWLGKLKSDKRFVFKAAAQAQRAADWILNLHPEYAARPKSQDQTMEPLESTTV